MKRRFFILTAVVTWRRTAIVIVAVALVALVTLLAATVASFSRYPTLVLLDSNKVTYSATVVRGELCLNLQYSAWYPDDSKRFVFVFHPIPQYEEPFPAKNFWNRRGFWAMKLELSSYARRPLPNDWHAPRWFRVLGLANDVPVSALAVGIPMWLPVLFAALPPAWIAWKSVRRWNRLRAHCCVGCGYDLRASPERCPECGMESATSDRSLASH